MYQWLSHRLNRSVGSSICINGRVTVDTPVCNIICECLSSNCVEYKKQHNQSSVKTNEIIFFTYDINDFSKYEKLPVPSEAHTANEGKLLKIVGKGTIFVRHEVYWFMGKYPNVPCISYPRSLQSTYVHW